MKRLLFFHVAGTFNHEQVETLLLDAKFAGVIEHFSVIGSQVRYAGFSSSRLLSLRDDLLNLFHRRKCAAP